MNVTGIELDREQLKNSILDEIQDLEKNIEELKVGSEPVAPDDALGRVTRMEAIAARGVSETSLKAAETKLLKLRHVLKKLDDPEFGYCIECGDDIPGKRLMLMPESPRCVHCASAR